MNGCSQQHIAILAAVNALTIARSHLATPLRKHHQRGNGSSNSRFEHPARIEQFSGAQSHF
jgi:hypothetical protein